MAKRKQIVVSPSIHRRLLAQAAFRRRPIQHLACDLLDRGLAALEAEPLPPNAPRRFGGRGDWEAELKAYSDAVRCERHAAALAREALA